MSFCYYCNNKATRFQCSATKVFFCNSDCQTKALNDINNNYREMIGAPVNKKVYRTIIATYSPRTGGGKETLKVRISGAFDTWDRAEIYFVDVFHLWLDQNGYSDNPYFTDDEDEDEEEPYDPANYPNYGAWKMIRGGVKPEESYISFQIVEVPVNHKYMIVYAHTHGVDAPYTYQQNYPGKPSPMKEIYLRVLTGKTKQDIREEFKRFFDGDSYKEAVKIAKERKKTAKKQGDLITLVKKNLFKTKRK